MASLSNYSVMTFDHFIKFSFVKATFQSRNDLAHGVMCELLEKYANKGKRTRAGTNGNWEIKLFTTNLKPWLKGRQQCEHWEWTDVFLNVH